MVYYDVKINLPEKGEKMFKNKKIILSFLIFCMYTFSVFPAQAGYYKTIYVEETLPSKAWVVHEVIEVPQKTVIIHENNYPKNRVFPYSDSSFWDAAGFTAFVNGVALGSLVTHRPARFHKPLRHFPVYRPHHR